MCKLGYIIFSDLDGTLLDHFDYQFAPAKKTLATLADLSIPVVLNTSKTKTESISIRKQISLENPFIVENGAAIYMPIGTFPEQPNGTVEVENFWVKTFCQPKEHWLAMLNKKELRHFKKRYLGFSDMSLVTVSKLTGLSFQQSELAKQRQYGEPIKWLGSDTSKEDFISQVQSYGACVTQGGRFLHVGGECNKGAAMQWLASQYQILCPDLALSTIALGDGENDSSMLEAANIAVQIRSPIHPFPRLRRDNSTIQTSLYGPEGWAEAINQILTEKQLYPSTKREVYHG
jgi:mannosyl-3-phosphoglycerate phosphatase